LKTNIVFLFAGIFLSVVSKVCQFKYKNMFVGNILIIPAAAFLCLALLFSLNKYVNLFNQDATKVQAVVLAGLACGTVASFQLMMILLFNKRYKLGMLLLLSFCVCSLLFLKAWF
jgi:hypothetical protein